MTTKPGTFPLRLPVSLKAAIEKQARQGGTSMNQFIVLVVAEKLSAMEATEQFFARRKGEGDSEAAIRFLRREGGGPPRAGDELPEEYR
jgi:hypothetical protein